MDWWMHLVWYGLGMVPTLLVVDAASKGNAALHKRIARFFFVVLWPISSVWLLLLVPGLIAARGLNPSVVPEHKQG